MAKKTQSSGNLHDSLRLFALKFPEAEEGIACKGTAIECVTVLARKKTYLFFGKKELRLKLSESIPEATKLSKARPESVKVGAGGWIAVTNGQEPPAEVLQRWIEESFRLIVHKDLVAQLAAAKKPTSR